VPSGQSWRYSGVDWAPFPQHVLKSVLKVVLSWHREPRYQGLVTALNPQPQRSDSVLRIEQSQGYGSSNPASIVTSTGGEQGAPSQSHSPAFGHAANPNGMAYRVELRSADWCPCVTSGGARRTHCAGTCIPVHDGQSANMNGSPLDPVRIFHGKRGWVDPNALPSISSHAKRATLVFDAASGTVPWPWTPTASCFAYCGRNTAAPEPTATPSTTRLAKLISSCTPSG
jgi:hypothetical protein